MDLFEAQGAKLEALEKVAANAGPFIRQAIKTIRTLDGEWTGEQLRLRLTRLGVKPHHHNAWGAMIHQAVKERVLVPTGRYTNMRVKKSHARRTEIYAIRK